MPRKKKGYTFKLVEFPDELVAAVKAGKGRLSFGSAVCAAVAKTYGVPYAPLPLGRPPKTEPAPKKKPRMLTLF